MNALVMNESKRFDSRIANLANTITLSAEQMIGTDNEFTEKKINHTILLFNKKEAKQVINEYGKLILNKFSDDDIRKYHKEGCHAVGMIHIKKKETPEKQFPKGIYDYWENYQIKESKTNKVHNLLIHYFRYGINEFLISGEKHSQISWITEGIRILINKTKKDNFIAISNNPFYALQNVLPNDLHENFRTIIKELCDKNYTTSKSDWESILLLIDKLFKLFDITLLSSQRKFLMWEEENNTEQINNRDNKEFTLNHFTYCDNETKRSVDIEFGSIHSVKGRTHLATLILETYYKTFNIKSILKYMCGINPSKLEEIHIKRLKCHYVAITRARALVCLAIPIDFVDENTRNKLESIGWSIKVVN